MAEVTKTRSPQTIGEDHARPGIFVFHTTFSVALHRSGKPAPSLTPEALGPRNCGQFSPAKAAEVKLHKPTMHDAITAKTFRRTLVDTLVLAFLVGSGQEPVASRSRVHAGVKSDKCKM